MFPTTTDRPPRGLIAAKVLLAVLLVVGTVTPEVGGFEGKGMAFRLPVFLAPALIVPILWWRRRGPYLAALDAALTLPFLIDIAANAFGLYDSVDATDDVLHALNWMVLVGGITATLAARTAGTPRWMQVLAGTGIGAIAIIGWEIAEYAVMQAGVGGLTLTYGDTLADLALSTAGGAVGALLSFRVWSPGPDVPAPAPAGV